MDSSDTSTIGDVVGPTPQSPQHSPALSDTSVFSLPPRQGQLHTGANTGKDTAQGPIEVIKHPQSKVKEIEWDLEVNSKWVFIGDSNLGILTHHNMTNVEIHSYPGDRFRHITTILEKFTPDTAVEVVLSAIGLNTRQQRLTETTIKHLKSLLERAAQAFP